MTSSPRSSKRLLENLAALLAPERDFVANAANTAAFLFHELTDVNWVGFYIRRGRELVLGPFQGKPACTRIRIGRGVCGTSALRRQTIVVPDVHRFPGHIACDPASRSEIVVPLMRGRRLLGVLDIDSARPGRFRKADRARLERIVEVFLELTDAP